VHRRLFASALTVALLGSATALSPAAGAAQDASTSRLAGRGVQVVKRPVEVREGDRFDVVVKVRKAAKAKKVELQMRTEDIFGNTVWETIKKRKVAAKSKQSLRAVAGPVNPLKLRVLATYKDGKKERTKPFGVTTWRWFDLHQFRPYYATYGTASHEYVNFVIAGRAFIGWYGLGTRETAWESRHTPGRHCKSFRGVAGVTDTSMDGSSAQITVVTDDTTVVYQSPSLTPGASYPFEVSLPRPYRLAIRSQLTSTARATAAIGAPQLLCDYKSS
jgi:hypothetical protein